AAGEVKAVIRNNSGENAVKITRVRVNGLDYKVSGAAGKLEPGESRVVTLTPKDGASGLKYGSFDVKYIKTSGLPLIKTRTVYFVQN
nr:hypothetical protein [Clostridia bacterium]